MSSTNSQLVTTTSSTTEQDTAGVGLAHTRSLVNLVLDLVELDLNAPENENFVKETFSQLQNKVESYYLVDRFADSQIDMLKLEVDHLRNQIKKYEMVQARLRDQALMALKLSGTKKLESKTGHHISQKVSESVEINDVNALPDWAVRREVILTPKKLEIKEMLKAKKVVPGAFLVEKEYASISRPRGKKE